MLKHLIAAIIFLSMLLACSENEKVVLEFRIAEDEPASDLTEIVSELTGEILYLHNAVLVNQYDVESAAVVIQSTCHRRQVNARMRELGSEPQPNDFIYWIWLGKPKAVWNFINT